MKATHFIANPLDVDFEGGAIKFQGFDREAKVPTMLHTIKAGNRLLWFEVIEQLSPNGVDNAVHINNFGWMDKYKLAKRAAFTRKSADTAKLSISGYFKGPTRKSLGMDYPRKDWVTTVTFSTGWILINSP